MRSCFKSSCGFNVAMIDDIAILLDISAPWKALRVPLIAFTSDECFPKRHYAESERSQSGCKLIQVEGKPKPTNRLSAPRSPGKDSRSINTAYCYLPEGSSRIYAQGHSSWEIGCDTALHQVVHGSSKREPYYGGLMTEVCCGRVSRFKESLY